MSNGAHQLGAAGELPMLDPQPRPKFQSFSSEAKDERVPWLLASPVPTPSPGANERGLGGGGQPSQHWTNSTMSVGAVIWKGLGGFVPMIRHAVEVSYSGGAEPVVSLRPAAAA